MPNWRKKSRGTSRICINCDNLYFRERRKSGRCPSCLEEKREKSLKKFSKFMARRKQNDKTRKRS